MKTNGVTMFLDELSNLPEMLSVGVNWLVLLSICPDGNQQLPDAIFLPPVWRGGGGR
jgi:hypothetical protein